MTWETFNRGPGWPDEYRLGGGDVYVNVARSSTAFDEPDVWDVIFRLCGTSTIQAVRGLAKAQRIGAFLYAELLPEHTAAEERSEARWEEHERARAIRVEEERPGREKAARELAARLAKAPVEEAARCGECAHVDDPDEFDMPGYECSRCGSTGRGPDGRRCDVCHIFRARSSDLSCPSCEAPLDAVETVAVKRDGNALVEVPDAEAERTAALWRQDARP